MNHERCRLPVSKLAQLGLWIVLCVAQTATAQAEPNTHVLVMLPIVSHVGIVGHDEVRTVHTPATTNVGRDGQVRTIPSQTHTPEAASRQQYGLLGLSLGRDWMHVLRTEVYAALLLDSPHYRGLAGLRAGPVLRLLDRDSADAAGATLRFVPMAGIAYRGQLYEWIHANDWRGQRSLAVTATPAIEATYYSSAAVGWTARLKSEFSYVFSQIGSAAWYDSESGGYYWDGYRWGLTGGIELGVVF